MSKRYKITMEQKLEIEAARKTNKDKNVENRLKALFLRAEGQGWQPSSKTTAAETIAT